MATAWEKTAQDKKHRIAESVPKEWRIEAVPQDDNVMGYAKASGILSNEELSITESSAVDLVAKMAAGKLTSVAVTTAFCKRAALAQQLVGNHVSAVAGVNEYRQIVPSNSFLRWHLLVPKNLILIIVRLAESLALCMVFPYP